MYQIFFGKDEAAMRNHPTLIATRLAAALACFVLGPGAAFSQEGLGRVEITGSSVKRIAAEGALPVQVFTREDIKRTGATSTVDLIQTLPAVQGSMGTATAVGSEVFGFAGVSLRNLGEARTLVLLNGKRITQFGGQSFTGSGAAVDLNAIPLAAIDRVEILTDGASALYGSEAMAGVINFITRKNTNDGDVTAGFTAPSGGARETRLSATKGLGDYDADGYNLLLSASKSRRTRLESGQRDYARTALLKFSENGKNYQINSGSPSNIPANVSVPNIDPNKPDELVSPYFLEHGACPANSFQFGDRACYYDFATGIEIYPEQESKNLFVQSSFNLTNNHRLSSELLYAQNRQIARTAPVPGSVSIDVANLPASIKALTGTGIPATGTISARYRAFDLGQRTTDDRTDLLHFTTSLDGTLDDWDYSATFIHSESRAKSFNLGYPEDGAFQLLTESGQIDPFVGPSLQSAATLAAMRATLRDGYFNGGKAALDAFVVRANRELTLLDGGPLNLGSGFNLGREQNNNAPSELAQGLTGIRFGDQSVVVPYSLSRRTAGAYLELVAPVAKSLELTGSVRYDKYSRIGDTTNTKFAVRWQPSADLMLRSSIGTGFRAPTVSQVQAPEQQFGFTGDTYDCSSNPALAAEATKIGAVCRPDGDQYDVFAGGNTRLRPEKSTQFSLGIRLEPAAALSLGADFWAIGIKDVIDQLPESVYFSDPAKYSGLFRKLHDNVAKKDYLAIFQGVQNLGNTYNSGIDFDVTARTLTSVGLLRTQVVATYMLRNTYQLTKNGEYFSSLARYGEDTKVTFRWQGRWVTTLASSAGLSNSLTVNFKSSYADSPEVATVVDANGVPTSAEETVQRRVKHYLTLDWQGNWTLDKALALQVGVLNLLDTAPPFSIAQSGLNKGQMVGYDDRYYDPRGRSIYANLSYRF
jgi:iron complex outermembrane receptor protein